VLITSFEPLKIYVFQEGLTRFASEPYSSGTKFNKFSHLTNYSINKKNINFVQNETLEHDDYGFKWSLSALWGHLEQIGIDMDLLWSKIYDLIIKSIIAAEDKIQGGISKYWGHKSNCFEILGFDVLIDSELKPWLLEANLSPSLSSDSPLDFKIKSNLITNAFNIVGFKKYDRRKESVNKIKHRMKGIYARGKSLNSRYGSNFSYNYRDGKQNKNSFAQAVNPKEIDAELLRYLQYDPTLAPHRNLIKKIIPMKFKEVLKTALEENSRCGNFIRIYPAEGTNIYDKYFKSVRPYNVFLYKCLYTNEIIPAGISEQIWDDSESIASNPQTVEDENEEFNSSQNLLKSKIKKNQRPQTVKLGPKQSMKTQENGGEKIIITGDDVLIEYVHRIITALTLLQEDNLTPDIKLGIDKFILHYVWHTKDPAWEHPMTSLRERLQTRYEEMRQRRKRLVRSIYKRESKLDIFEASYKKMTQQKMAVLKNFNGKKLEEMLKTSTKNVAQEVVSILINHSRDVHYGILPDLEKNFLNHLKSSREGASTKPSSGVNRTSIMNKLSQNEMEDGGEDDEKEDNDSSIKHVLASSCSVNVNKFSNITDFNNKLSNQPPQLPPTINYNNYFNSKSRYSSKTRKSNINTCSAIGPQNEEKAVRLQNERPSTSGANDLAARRNSLKISSQDRKSPKNAGGYSLESYKMSMTGTNFCNTRSFYGDGGAQKISFPKIKKYQKGVS
jgi:hypothetical protein